MLVIINTESNIEVTVEGGADETNITFLGQTRTYSCRTYVGVPLWAVTLGNENFLIAPSSSSFNDDGITIPRLPANDQPSVLTAVPSASNNHTGIQCVQHLGGVKTGNGSEYFVLLVLGK